MIVSRAPTRLTLAGGGTDIQSYYRRNGGFLVACAINKYIWVTATRGYYEYIHLKYSSEEKVQKVEQIQHPIFREAMDFCNQRDPIELASLSDVPSDCGLGSSSSFTVALLQALYSYQQIPTTQQKVAEDACYIEIDRLGEPIGKQDQYIAALGGLTCLTFSTDGKVTAARLGITDKAVDKLRQKLVLFYTGLQRRSSYVLTEVKQELEEGGRVVELLNIKKAMAYETKRLLEGGKLDKWGETLNDYWRLQRKVSNKISNPFIDNAYETAIKNGALGGKLQGAGGGGFLMFYCPLDKKPIVRALSDMGLREMEFDWDYNGVQSYVL